jgi:hypothetical protein
MKGRASLRHIRGLRGMRPIKKSVVRTAGKLASDPIAESVGRIVQALVSDRSLRRRHLRGAPNLRERMPETASHSRDLSA